MADPLSIAVSIIGVASAGIKLSSTLCRYAETIANADNNIRSIARDLSITSSVVTDLGNLLQQEADGHSPTTGAFDAALEAVCECNQVFQDIQTLLDRAMRFRDGETPTMSRLRRLTWPLTEMKLNVLHARLERLKNTLVLVLNVLTYVERTTKKENRLLYVSESSEKQQQIDRLILLNEQASRRHSHFRGMLSSLEPKQTRKGTHESPQQLKRPESSSHLSETSSIPPLTSSATDASSITLAPSIMSARSSNCACGDKLSPTPTSEMRKEDTKEYAKHLRIILSVIEDASSTQSSIHGCETVFENCKDSMEALQTLLQGEKRKRRFLKRFSLLNSIRQ